MARSFYSYIGRDWRKAKDDEHLAIRQRRLYQWRREPVCHRVEYPTRLDRARNLGYRAKQGYVVVRTRVRRGGLHKSRWFGGKGPKAMGTNKITASKNIKRIAEERTAKKYPNMQVLNSYWVGEDGRHKFYEVILVDPAHPAIQNDPKINWICAPGNKKRVFRGKTSAGQKGRGLHKRGKGTEKNRPSIRANKNMRQ